MSNSKGEIWTVRRLLDWTAGYFRSKGIASARLDAELLLGEALGKSRLELYLDVDCPVTPEERSRFRQFVRRRGAREPLAYILGEKEFWSIPVKVAPGVLIPRPETERIVEIVREHLPAGEPLRMADMGAGSGCLTLALAAEYPDAEIWSVEKSEAALEILRENVRRNGLKSRVHVLKSDWFQELPLDTFGVFFHVVVSNPPYLSRREMDDLQPEIKYHEPRNALDGGPDGLDAYPVLAGGALERLVPGGFIVVETGCTQGEAVREIFQSAGLFRVSVLRDYSQRDRVVIGFKKET